MLIQKTPLVCASAGAVVFCILLERLSLGGVATGLGAGLLFSAAVRPVGAAKTKPLRGLWLLRYGAWLLIDMAVSTARQMRAVLCRKPEQPVILHLHPQAGERGRVLVANSITLTPGTVTLEETAEDYAVLCANAPEPPETCQAIAARFEGRLPGEEARS